MYQIREGILRGVELLPMPKKCPLNPIIHSKRKYDGSIDESFVVIEKQEDIYTFNAEHPRPAHAVKPDVEVLPWN